MTPPKSRLSPATLHLVPTGIARPRYDRETAAIGIVHFGPGVFHRTHQTLYVEQILETDPRWAICGVSLRGTTAKTEMTPQGGLYTCAELSEEPRFQIVGALKEVLAARLEPDAVLARLVAPQTKILTMTVTESGYCLTRDGELDFDRPEIVADLKTPHRPTSMIGWLVLALQKRRAAGLPPFVIIPCDNLSNNGTRLRRAVLAFASAQSADLARWIEDEAKFPRTMVDSIAPATDAQLRDLVAAKLGLWDDAPVQHEPFRQWVIEDLGFKDGPDWAGAGVTLSRNVDAYDRAKLRLLNGAHSSLAYLGLLAGYGSVSSAMDDKALAGFVECMMRQDIAPSLAGSEINLNAYIGAILARFRNKGLVHTLAQIAYDGSQKLPYRLLPTIAEARSARRSITRLALPIAGWMRFVVMRAMSDEKLVDPLADQLLALARACTGDAQKDTALFLTMDTVFSPELAADPGFRQAVMTAYASLLQSVPQALTQAATD